MNLKLLKILQGTITEQESPSEYENLDDAVTAGSIMMKHIRLFYLYVQSSGIDIRQFINQWETKGLGHRDTTFGEIERGMKYVGLHPQPFGKSVMSPEDIVYLLSINYIHNGGDRRNFKNGDISLIPGTKFLMDVDSKQKIIELVTQFVEVYGTDEEKASNAVMEDPDNFEVDRESYDHEYTDEPSYGEEIVDIKKETFRLEPKVFNLKGPFPHNEGFPA